MKLLNKVTLLLLLACSMISASAQQNIPLNSKLAMYVEFGGKGIKFGVLAYTDANYRKYTPIENSELNVGLSKSIQTTGNISPQDITSAVSSTNDRYLQLLDKYKSYGLKSENVFFYTSSGVGVARNVQELCNAVREKTGHNVLVVKEDEEAKYTISGTIPYEKIESALVLDQGGSNTKGGYVLKDGRNLVAIPTNFDLGSVRLSDLISTRYMTSYPDDQDEYLKAYITATNKCFDSLKLVINRTFSNIDGAEFRDELYLSGGAAFAIATLIYPEGNTSEQLQKIDIRDIKTFYLDIQDRDGYNKVRNRTFTNEKTQKMYRSALTIYNQQQLISATKLLLTYINALSGDDKKIFFNRYGMHSMPSMLMGRVLRGDIRRW